METLGMPLKTHRRKKENMSGLFKDMAFYLLEPIDSNLGQLISHYGGHVLSEPRKTCIVIVNSSSNNTSKFPTVISQDFVNDSIEKGVIQDRRKYTIRKLVKAADIKLNLSQSDQEKLDNGKLTFNKEAFANTNGKKTSKFTKPEDEFILDLVRRNPNLRSTHSFFERISQFLPLAGHTGNSIRYRFRKILSKEMKYYYLVDPLTNELKIDQETNEPIKIYETPSLIKSQYTAEEDLFLCKSVLDYINGKTFPHIKRKRLNVSIPEIVYQNISNEMSNHSALSYRDRYRKFACKYGLQNYIDYYENCLKEGTTPNPMKNLSSRTDRKGVPRQMFSEAIVDDTNIDDDNDDDNDDENVNEVQPTNEKIETSKEKLTTEPLKKKLKLDTSKIKLEDPDSSVAVAAAAIANVSEQLPKPRKKKSKKKPSKATTDDQLPKENIIEEPTTGTNIFEEDIVNIVKSELVDNDVVDVVDDDNEIREDEGLMDYKQLLEIDPEPLKNRQLNPDIDVIINNVSQCFDSFVDGTPYDIFKDLNDSTGISMLWLTYWFDCSCGMLQTFYEAIIHYLQSGDLILENVSGFWTEKDDELLKKDPNNLELLKLHGEESVEKRKTVLF